MSRLIVMLLGATLIGAAVVTLVFDRNLASAIILLAIGLGAFLFFFLSR
jgi:hypothetical protein